MIASKLENLNNILNKKDIDLSYENWKVRSN